MAFSTLKKHIFLIFILFILLSSYTVSYSQEVAISNTGKYYAACFYQVRDTLLSIKEQNEWTDVKKRYFKFVTHVYNAETHEITLTYNSQEDTVGLEEPKFKLAFSASDNHLFILANQRKVFIISPEHGYLQEYQSTGFVLDSTKQLLALMQSNKVQFIDPSTLEKKKQIKIRTKKYNKIEFTQDEKFIVLSGDTKKKKNYAFLNLISHSKKLKISGNTYSYSPEKENFLVFKSGILYKYRSSDFKEKKNISKEKDKP